MSEAKYMYCSSMVCIIIIFVKNSRKNVIYYFCLAIGLTVYTSICDCTSLLNVHIVLSMQGRRPRGPRNNPPIENVRACIITMVDIKLSTCFFSERKWRR